MKKVLMGLAVAGMLLPALTIVSANTVVCGDPALSDGNTTYISCSNGPVINQPEGWRLIAPGEEDCPWWFPPSGCVTPRPLGTWHSL